jgi:hypothetical protein
MGTAGSAGTLWIGDDLIPCLQGSNIMQKYACAAAIALGTLTVYTTSATCGEALNAGRETIIQGVRDDVRNKIRARNAPPAVPARSPRRDNTDR